ncbi:MAG: hypothetical protein PWQ96_1215 [Clostridia bacterium]|jgi:hypothetical protein|nr:hypothetical protein [Clostridiales bacterium]MDK2985573.1 hypothetical protein [Clostridia bacterium]
MSWTVLIPVIVLFLFYLSGNKRAKAKYSNFKTLPVPEDDQANKGPVASAALEIVAMAGGIYLALTSLASFLQLSIPKTIEFTGVTFDPIAAISIILALLQPFVGEMLKKYYGNNNS